MYILYQNVKTDLEENGISLEYFDHFFKMEPGLPKNFTRVWKHYKIKPSQLLVIGDRYDRDIQLALKQGCNTCHIPEYYDRMFPDFDISKIKL